MQQGNRESGEGGNNWGGDNGGICYERVAEAVNVAVRMLREETKGVDDDDDDDDVDMEFEDEPFLWAGIVYMGL